MRLALPVQINAARLGIIVWTVNVGQMKARRNGAAVVFNMIVEASSDQFFSKARSKISSWAVVRFSYIFFR